MFKIANKRVNGWDSRHINTTAVAKALYTRRSNGYNLFLDEQQFLGDYESLKAKYNEYSKMSANELMNSF